MSSWRHFAASGLSGAVLLDRFVKIVIGFNGAFLAIAVSV
jgi:hypothetical protein